MAVSSDSKGYNFQKNDVKQKNKDLKDSAKYPHHKTMIRLDFLSICATFSGKEGQLFSRASLDND